MTGSDALGERPRPYAVLAAAGALALLGLVLWLADPRRIYETLARLEAWQAAALVATSFGVSGFTALAWHTILRRYGHWVHPWRLFELTVVAFAAGWLIPSGFVAGIPITAWLLRRHGVPFSRGMASFAIGRFLELTAYGAIVPVALLSAVGAERWVRAGAGATLGVLAIAYLDLFLDWRIARAVLGRLRRLVPRARRAIDATIGFCADVAFFFAGPSRYIVVAAAFSFAAIGMALVRAMLANAFLELRLSTPQVVVMFAITVFLMAVPFLPGAIGAFEGGIAGAFELIGRSKAAGVAYAVTIHAAELVVVAAGIAILGHLGVRHFRPRRDETRPARRHPLDRTRAAR